MPSCVQAEEEAAQTAASLAAFPDDTAPAQQPGTQLQLQQERSSTAALLHTSAHQQTAVTTLPAGGRTSPQIGQLGLQPARPALRRGVELQPVAAPASVHGRASGVDAIAAPQAAVQATQGSLTGPAAVAPGLEDGSTRPGACMRCKGWCERPGPPDLNMRGAALPSWVPSIFRWHQRAFAASCNAHHLRAVSETAQ